MKLLPEEFEGVGEVAGVKFIQLKKSDKAFLYKLIDTETGEARYEVFKRKISKASEANMGGVTVFYEEREMYPKSRSFGLWAWCIGTYDRAIAKFDEINAKDDTRTKTAR